MGQQNANFIIFKFSYQQFFVLKTLLVKKMSTKFWVVLQKALFFFLNRPETLEYMQYFFMLQVIQKTGDFYSDKTKWEVARSSLFSVSLSTFNVHEICLAPKQVQELRYTCQTVSIGYSALQDVQMTWQKTIMCCWGFGQKGQLWRIAVLVKGR